MTDATPESSARSPRRAADQTLVEPSDRWLVLHAHFYQPPRENPWTEVVPVETSAAPFHDWNERITAECYRPNGFARIFDEQGRVSLILNNYAHLSFNVGPTLAAWLAQHQSQVYSRILDADAHAHTAIAQGYNHAILPLCNERDLYTQIRWGLADFRHRFRRRPLGLWLPECAVDERVMAALADEGVGFVILAPGAVSAVRTLGSAEVWREVANDGVSSAGGGDGQAALDIRRSFRWTKNDDGTGPGVDIVLFEPALSQGLAFGSITSSAEALVAAARAGGVTIAATDGETFGHHHKFTERTVAYALSVLAPREGLHTGAVAGWLGTHPPTLQARIRESSWSCVHGVGRWREDCGCSTGGRPGWNQRWRAPLRRALDLVQERAIDVFESRGRSTFTDAWAARDAYIEVVLDERAWPAFANRHVVGDEVTARTLLELQRHCLLMYTSCGWFFADPSGLETLQVLRYAARVLDLLDELGDDREIPGLRDELASIVSNAPEEGDGIAIWDRYVAPTRAGAARVAAHLALAELLGAGQSPHRFAAFEVRVARRARHDDGHPTLELDLDLRHVRTKRRQVFEARAEGLQVRVTERRPDDHRNGSPGGSEPQTFTLDALLDDERLAPVLVGEFHCAVSGIDALALYEACVRLGVAVDLERAQEHVAELLSTPGARHDEPLRLLAAELGMAVSA